MAKKKSIKLHGFTIKTIHANKYEVYAPGTHWANFDPPDGVFGTLSEAKAFIEQEVL